MALSPAPRSSSWRRRGLAVATLLFMHGAMLAFSAARHSPAPDEVHHLMAGVYHWQFGRFDLDRGNPPLTGLVAACLVLPADPKTDWIHVPYSYRVGDDFMVANGARTAWLVTLGRWACMVFSLTGGYFCYRWATELYGHASGVLVLMIWCLSPSVLAHGSLVTGDMPAMALGIAAFYAFWKWLVRPSLATAVFAGLFLGLAELTKFVWVLLFGLWPVLWILWRLLHRSPVARSGWRREAGHLVLIVLLSLYVINLGYAFDRPFQPLGRFEVGRRILGRLGLSSPDRLISTGACGSWAAAAPVPLPEDYVLGIDDILSCSANQPPIYLRHEWREDGFWHFHPYALLIKTPLGTLGLLAFAGALTFFPACRVQWKTEVLLALSASAILGFVMVSGTPQHHRYALPMLPFLLILAGKTISVLPGRSRSIAMLVGGLLAWSTLSGVFVYPHSLSYFNELGGGPLGGHAHLIGSSIEFDQDYFYLKRWYERNAEARPLVAAWHTRRARSVVRTILGEISTDVPAGLTANKHHKRTDMLHLGPQPGWYAVSVTRLHSPAHELAYFFRFQPVATAGYSIYIYHITLEEANRVRRELGMPPLPTGWKRHWRDEEADAVSSNITAVFGRRQASLP
ncbi:MAG: glycosyltransferase family 39 protein [Planctomycetes bacterium]|nr:glycosyltransferase family 39 protein [Planctomycetota bacterium]